MSARDRLWMVLLAVAAALIWLRNTAWISTASETLPILAALPLFVWLGAPWRIQRTVFQLHRDWLAVGGILFAAGVATDLTFFFAAAWTAALWSWLRQRVEPDSIPGLHRLLVLPMLAFPWITLDAAPLGWGFRLSAAWSVKLLFGALGFVVEREGTSLLVQGVPIAVAPACSGLNALQAMLIAGTALAVLELRQRRGFWWSLTMLPALAWIANTLRVVALTAVALTFGSEFAGGWFHGFAGWLVLMFMFGLNWLSIRLFWRAVDSAPAAA